MRKRLWCLLISLLLLAGCGNAATQPSPTLEPTPVEEVTPTPDLEKEERNVFVNALLREVVTDRAWAAEEEYETGKFIALSHNAIERVGYDFFLAMREQLENLEDIDFSVFWDPEADPAPFEAFLENIKSFRSEEYPVTWANVNYDEVTDFRVNGMEGEEVTVQYYGRIALFYPDDPKFPFTYMLINHKLTFVCRDKCWYISAIEDLGP